MWKEQLTFKYVVPLVPHLPDMIDDVVKKQFKRDVQKGSSFLQMEMHNGLKHVIILGVILQTSSVKADR
jgi:hypothetical protein